jgi:hypothetical protein
MTTKFNQRTQTSEDNEKKTISHTRFPTKKQTVGTTRREARFKEEPRKKTQKKFQPLVFLPFKSYICQQYRHHL